MPYTATDQLIDRAWRDQAPPLLADPAPAPSAPGRPPCRLQPHLAARIRDLVRTNGCLTEEDLHRLGLTAPDIATLADQIRREARAARARAEGRR